MGLAIPMSVMGADVMSVGRSTLLVANRGGNETPTWLERLTARTTIGIAIGGTPRSVSVMTLRRFMRRIKRSTRSAWVVSSLGRARLALTVWERYKRITTTTRSLSMFAGCAGAITRCFTSPLPANKSLWRAV